MLVAVLPVVAPTRAVAEELAATLPVVHAVVPTQVA